MKIFLALILLVPIITSILNKRWIPSSIFILGYVVFGSLFFQKWEGMEDLGAFAGLFYIVLPLYIIAALIWIVLIWLNKRKRLEKKPVES